jgi:DnaJ-class molecular chaperone
MGSEKNHFDQQDFEVWSTKEGKVQKTEWIGWLRLRGGGVHSLYEILGVHEKASAQEIRSAYRRAALHIHPDKNLDSPEEAAIKFRKLQHAYEVLGNPSSRASYDSYSGTRHVEGEEQASAGNMEEEEHLDLSRFFVAAAYSGYHEGQGGFYSVYSGIFECISALEAVCADARSSAGRSEARRGGASGDSRLPCFGQAGSSYQEVR